MLVYTVQDVHMRIPGPSFHGFTPIPPVPPLLPPAFYGPFGKACTWHIETPHNMEWIVPFTHKFSKNVLANGNRLAKQGHDTGTLVPHFSIPMNNIEWPLTLLFSKYKLLFGASKVHANGSPVAVFDWVFAPPMFCNFPCALPGFGFNAILPFPCTVKVNMSFGDFIAGWIKVGLEMGLDTLFNWIGNGTWFDKWKSVFSKFGEKLGGSIGAAAIRGVAPDGMLMTATTFKGTVTNKITGEIAKSTFDLPPVKLAFDASTWAGRKLASSFGKKVTEDVFKQLGSLPFKGTLSVPMIGGASINVYQGKVTVGKAGDPSATGQLPWSADVAPAGGFADKLGAAGDPSPVAELFVNGAFVAP